MAQFEALDDSKLGKAYAIFIKGLFNYSDNYYQNSGCREEKIHMTALLPQ